MIQAYESDACWSAVSLNVWREGVLVFRGWVVLRLGVSKD